LAGKSMPLFASAKKCRIDHSGRGIVFRNVFEEMIKLRNERGV